MKFGAFVALFLFGLPSLASPSSAAETAFRIVNEDVSTQRRSLTVRIPQRIAEPQLLELAQQLQTGDPRTFSRTYINFVLPSMTADQGAWAIVLFSPEPKVSVLGLSRADEDQLVAEHAADKRPLLGSWLTSPPAMPGRLTIYSDHGKIFAEWRLRSGQKTTDELRDVVSKSQRRFDVIGGGYFVLSRSGDLEIWDNTIRIATAERIGLTPSAVAGHVPLSGRPLPTQSHEAVLAASMPKPATGSTQRRLPEAVVVFKHEDERNSTAEAVTVAKPVRKKTAKAQTVREPSRTHVATAVKSKTMTTGEEISAKISGRF